MNQEKKILLTGAAGFIGSYLLGFLNREGQDNIIIVDDFSRENKKPNYETKKYTEKIERENLFGWLDTRNPKTDPITIGFVFHLGARTDTTEFDYPVLEKWNVAYSKQLWQYCARHHIPLIYASSAATYGAGEQGYKDDHEIVEKLKPLNPYGISKNEFDRWVLRQSRDKQPPCWAGLKFFNVYGPNEYHKGRMASMIFHGFNQIRETGKVKLFRSHKPGYKDGEQLRDFIYAEDVARVCNWMMQSMNNGPWTMDKNGIYNLGTGKARTFNDLVNAIFSCLHLPSHIEYIDTPADIRDKYQYFTEADIKKLRTAGYPGDFYSLEEGVADYVKNFLEKDRYY